MSRLTRQKLLVSFAATTVLFSPTIFLAIWAASSAAGFWESISFLGPGIWVIGAAQALSGGVWVVTMITVWRFWDGRSAPRK